MHGLFRDAGGPALTRGYANNNEGGHMKQAGLSKSQFILAKHAVALLNMGEKRKQQ